MSDTKFTPGPWVVYEDYRSFDVGVGFYEVCSIDYVQSTYESDKANAYLIAASPRMYRALENLLNEVEREGTYCKKECEEARKALAKARGEG